MAVTSSTKIDNTESPTRSFKFSSIWDKFGMLMVFAGLFLLCSLFVPYFATFINMKGLGLAISMSGMVACAMLFCLACGDLDLSIASVIACSGVVTAVAINATSSVVLGIGAGLLSGVLFGLLNGFVIAKLQINALITTLATMQIARGLGYIISDGKAVGITEEHFFTLGNSSLLGIPTPIWLTIVTFAIFAFLLNRTVYGRNTL
ncbi:ABC transporter permease subunit, partial [Vibrio anguillarum]|nr:L-arabinose ABC transporter permease AraH [Vibrio anguillarum]